MKTAIKRENDECLVITTKHVNRLGTPKLWAISHENGLKTRKWRVFGHALKHVSGLTVILNRPGTPILWAITHENGHNTQNRRVFGHNSQTCKSPWNPKTMGSSS
jgi:hypothetical protein